MPTLDEVKLQLRKMDATSSFFARKEIRELPSILWEGEDLRGAIQGTYNGRSGLLVATSRRLIFIDKGWVSLRVEDFPYEKITSIQYETGWVFGKITIFASGNRADIGQLVRDKTRPFAEMIRNFAGVHGPLSSAAPTARVDVQRDDPISAIERLARLRDQGILTREEFDAQKAKILGAMPG